MSKNEKKTGGAGDAGLDAAKEIRRWEESHDYLHLITKTFSALSLWHFDSICDTLLSLVSTFLEAQHGGVVVHKGGTSLWLVSTRDAAAAEIVGSDEAIAFWCGVMDEKGAQAFDRAELAKRWPGAPDWTADGLATVTIDIHDQAVGVLFVADRFSKVPWSEQDLAFLRGASGIGALALTTAQAINAQQDLARSLEEKAADASREAQAKASAMADLAEKLRIIERQREAIEELSTPILQVWDDILALPVIGVVDSKRSMDIMERLLAEIVARQSRFVILDITGVEVVDTKTADNFIKIIKAAELLGTKCILTGLRPAVAQTLVAIGVDLSSTITLRNLQEGLRECLRQLEKRRVANAALRPEGR